MARMLGRMRPPWCPICCRPPGPDCPEEGKDTRGAKRAEQRRLLVELRDAAAERSRRMSQEPDLSPMDPEERAVRDALISMQSWPEG